jgi:competence protein ComFB
MKVHNIMEEYVKSRIELLYNQLNQNKPSWLTCDCDICRDDAISYVLNRIPPRYIVSGRGAVHNSDLLNNSQINADVDALGLEGIRLINSVQRPYHKTPAAKKNDEHTAAGPSFNFPVFIGGVYDGMTFEPLTDAQISLKNESCTAEMIDRTWSNPCSTYKSTRGAYSFWVKPIAAEKSDISRHFHFTLEVTAEGFTRVNYGFDIPVVSETDRRLEMNSSYSLKIQDLFLFKTDIKNNME